MTWCWFEELVMVVFAAELVMVVVFVESEVEMEVLVSLLLSLVEQSWD